MIVGRQSLLASYLSSLLSLPNALMNVHVLSFLGLLSTSREDLPRRTSITSTAQPEDKAKPRQVRGTGYREEEEEAGHDLGCPLADY